MNIHHITAMQNRNMIIAMLMKLRRPDMLASIVMGIIIVFWVIVVAAVLSGAGVVALLVYSRLPI